MRKEEETKNVFDASYTVEAAFVLPIVFILVLLMIDLTLYYHDRVTLLAYLSDTARKEAQYLTYGIGTNEQMEEDVEIRLLISDAHLSREHSLTKLKITATMETRLFFVKLLPGGSTSGIRSEFLLTYDIFSREEKARISKAAFSLGTKVKGISENLNKLADLIGEIR